MVSHTGLPFTIERALTRLDTRMEAAIASGSERFGVEPGEDRFRGLYIAQADALRAVRSSAAATNPSEHGSDGEGLFDSEDLLADPRLRIFADAFELSLFDLSLLVLALAPEIDSRYERAVGYLHDDVTKRRPTVELALQLLCSSRPEQVRRRAHFRGDAPLVRHRLLWLDSNVQPGLGSALRIDEQALHILLDIPGLDSRLEPFVDLPHTPTAGSEHLLTRSEHGLVVDRARIATATQSPLVVLLEGPEGAGKRAVAELVARSCQGERMTFHVGLATGWVGTEQEFAELVTVVFREAWVRGAVLYVDGFEALLQSSNEGRRSEVVAAARMYPGVVILGTTDPWTPPAGALPSLVHQTLAAPAAQTRLAIWKDALQGLAVSEDQLKRIADRFTLTPGQISDIACRTRGLPAAGGSGDELLVRELFNQARAQSGHELDQFARRIRSKRRWDDLILPDDSLAQLKEMCAWVAHRERVLGSWGFADHLVRGRGVTALFSGPSGTGKTMAAEIVAGELGVDLFRIDLAGVISKYIGETERNLEKIFRAAEHSNGVLFFDEADALFGKRSEVRDSHDRYANVEISYLLQRMEEYEGIAILATNLRGNLDEAFIRRLAFSVHFPFPNAEHRLRIWKAVWPKSAPVGAAVDFEPLAQRFKLSGGNIRNVALAAAYSAAADGGTVEAEHLVHGVRREFQKMGKIATPEELGQPNGDVGR